MNRLIALTIWVFVAGVPFAEGAEPFTAVRNDRGAQEVVMTAKSYSFSPARVIVQVGVPVELRITKSGMTPHNFTINDSASGLDIKQKLSSSKPTVIAFTPEKKGEFPFFCSVKLPFGKSHRDKGMQGVLTVR